MAVYSIIPNTNVSFNDIRDTLNANGGSVTNDFITAFQERANIDPWSKWKPVSSNFMFSSLEAIKANNFGINIISGNSLASVYNQVKNNGNNGYSYARPTGGSISPYRLGDFRNYNTEASLPIEATYKNNETVKIGGVTSSNHNSYKKYLIGFQTENVETPDTSTYLSMGDIYRYYDNFGNKIALRRGLYITDGTNSAWSTEYVPWAETQWQRFMGKTVSTFEFLTNTNNNPDHIYTSNANDFFCALLEPVCSLAISSASPAGSKDVECYPKAAFRKDGGNYIDWSVYFSAIGDVYAGGTLTNVHAVLAKDKNGLNKVSDYKIADSLTVRKGETTIDYENSIIYIGSNTDNLYFLIYWNGKIQATTMVMAFSPGRPEI